MNKVTNFNKSFNFANRKFSKQQQLDFFLKKIKYDPSLVSFFTMLLQKSRYFQEQIYNKYSLKKTASLDSSVNLLRTKIREVDQLLSYNDLSIIINLELNVLIYLRHLCLLYIDQHKQNGFVGKFSHKQYIEEDIKIIKKIKSLIDQLENKLKEDYVGNSNFLSFVLFQPNFRKPLQRMLENLFSFDLKLNKIDNYVFLIDKIDYDNPCFFFNNTYAYYQFFVLSIFLLELDISDHRFKNHEKELSDETNPRGYYYSLIAYIQREYNTFCKENKLHSSSLESKLLF